MIRGTTIVGHLHVDNLWNSWDPGTPLKNPSFLLAPPDAHGLQVHLGRSQGVERWAEDSHLQALVSASFCYKL